MREEISRDARCELVQLMCQGYRWMDGWPRRPVKVYRWLTTCPQAADKALLLLKSKPDVALSELQSGEWQPRPCIVHACMTRQL